MRSSLQSRSVKPQLKERRQTHRDTTLFFSTTIWMFLCIWCFSPATRTANFGLRNQKVFPSFRLWDTPLLCFFIICFHWASHFCSLGKFFLSVPLQDFWRWFKVLLWNLGAFYSPLIFCWGYDGILCSVRLLRNYKCSREGQTKEHLA